MMHGSKYSFGSFANTSDAEVARRSMSVLFEHTVLVAGHLRGWLLEEVQNEPSFNFEDLSLDVCSVIFVRPQLAEMWADPV